MSDNPSMQTFNYYITTNPDEMDDGWPVSEAMAMTISEIYERVMALDPRVAMDLKRLIRTHPSVPAFRNLLSNYFRFPRRFLKSPRTEPGNTIELFPDHVFTRVN
ncbi:MAG: hypothetical protein IPK08_12025 [Bacteroidetes bacterium]|nr:hypothetical protein [Bacteroidota bacterium]